MRLRWLTSLFSHETYLYASVCALLTLQNSSYTLLRRYSSGVIMEEASSQSILAVGELLKLVFSFRMVLKLGTLQKEHGQAEVGHSGSAIAKRLIVSSGPMAVPAVIFLAMNMLSFVALRRISASTFSLIQQSKIIFTAGLSRAILNKQLSEARWRAIIGLLFALLVICDATHPKTCDGSSQTDEVKRSAADYLLGVAAVTIEAALSGLSNVYFERVLRTTSFSVWERNVQLAVYSLFIYVPMALMVRFDIFYGWSPLTWLIAFLGALGGVLIGLVINYCDSIVKNLALSFAIILTAILDWRLFDGPMNLPIAAAGGLVIICVRNYSSG